MVDSNKNGNLLIIVIVALVALVAGVYFMQSNGNTDGDETRVERAVEEFRDADNVGEGIEEAGDELRGDESTSEKIGEGIEEVGEDIEEATDGDGK